MATMTTDRGATCAPSWTPEWIERVKQVESEVGRPICGAHLPDNTPCTRTSDHPSGRCTHHGGHHLSGGPEGHRNAIIHGLYSRRLLICGDHCPRWFSCPYASADLLEIPLKNRPNCVYEQVEYDTLTGYTSPDAPGTVPSGRGPEPTRDCPLPQEPDGEPVADRDCPPPQEPFSETSGCVATRDNYNQTTHGATPLPAAAGGAPLGTPAGGAEGGRRRAGAGFEDYVALLHVMVGRAAASLSLYPLIKTKYDDNTLSTVPEYRPSAHLQAFLHLSREYRLAIRELTHIHGHGHGGAPRPSKPPKPPDPPRPLGLPDIMKPIMKKAEGVIEEAIAYKQREDALKREREREEARARGDQDPPNQEKGQTRLAAKPLACVSPSLADTGEAHGPTPTHAGRGDDGGGADAGDGSVQENPGSRSRAGDGALGMASHFSAGGDCPFPPDQCPQAEGSPSLLRHAPATSGCAATRDYCNQTTCEAAPLLPPAGGAAPSRTPPGGAAGPGAETEPERESG